MKNTVHISIVYNFSGRLIIEKQSNSSLLSLMKAIEKEIAVRAGTSK